MIKHFLLEQIIVFASDMVAFLDFRHLQNTLAKLEYLLKLRVTDYGWPRGRWPRLCPGGPGFWC